jgi:hypothetical protein
MRLVCTSNESIPYDTTVYDEATHRHLSFAADTVGHDPNDGPVPVASISLVMSADEGEQYDVGAPYDLELTAAEPWDAESEADREIEDTSLPEGDYAPADVRNVVSNT